MKKVEIYTDGACSGNPGPGGWGAILRLGPYEREMSGGESLTTNNRMELLAAVAALEALKEPCEVLLTSDSQYLTRAIKEGWLQSWKKKGWRKADNKTPANIDLWLRLDELLSIHKVTFRWVRGHGDNPFNNRCDRLAVEARRKAAGESEAKYE